MERGSFGLNYVQSQSYAEAALHQQLQEAAIRRGCSVQQLILQSIKRLIAEEASTIRNPRAIAPCASGGTGDPANGQ